MLNKCFNSSVKYILFNSFVHCIRVWAFFSIIQDAPHLHSGLQPRRLWADCLQSRTTRRTRSAGLAPRCTCRLENAEKIAYLLQILRKK